MDQHGESGTNTMALDPVSPGSINSRDMLEEPTAPRRNSTDDNDTTRPRKRPAVMAGPEEHRENAVAAAPPNMGSSMNDTMKCSITDGHRVSETMSSISNTESNRTIQIRAPQGQSDGTHPPESELPGAIEAPYSQQSVELPDVGSDIQTVRSTSPELFEVEEVEGMVDGEDLSYHIKQVDQTTSFDPVDDYYDSHDMLRRIAHALDQSDCPVLELRDICVAISQVISSTKGDIDHFERLYEHRSDLLGAVPDLVMKLLHREVPFDSRFFERDANLDGLRYIGRFFAEVVQLATHIFNTETSKLRAKPLDDNAIALSKPYVQAIFYMLQKCPLYELLAGEGNAIEQCFPTIIASIAGPEGFLGKFVRLGDLVIRSLPSNPKLTEVTEYILAVAPHLVLVLDYFPRQAVPAEQENDITNKIFLHLTEFLILSAASLDELLASNVQSVNVKSLQSRICQLGELASQLYLHQPGNPKLSSKLRKYIAAYPWDLKPRELCRTVDVAYRFPYYFKMLCTSRMDIRLRGLTAINDTLLSAWRNHAQGRTGSDAPLLRYLVDFIIENRVPHYLVGPDSHSELIQRCSAVPSFLLVNRKMTEDIPEALWQPIMDNKDPRVVKATLNMHREMVQHMELDQLMSLCQRIAQLPFSSMDSFMTTFVACVACQIRLQYGSSRSAEPRRLSPHAYEMLIRLMRLASEQKEDARICEIFDVANKELTALADIGPDSVVRREILERCAEDLVARNGSVTGSTTVILSFLRRRPRSARADSPRANSPIASEDADWLIEKFDLATLIVRELSVFIERHRSDDSGSRMRQLKHRFDLLRFLLQVSPRCLSKELHAELWSCLVGEKALGSSERDQGFEFYVGLRVPDMERHPLLDSVYRDFLPSLDSEYFSPSLLDLCKASLTYLNRGSLRQETEAYIHVEGVEQLWRIIFYASNEQLAAATISYFVDMYLDAKAVTRNTRDIIQATHSSIIDRCIAELICCARTLSAVEIAPFEDILTIDDTASRSVIRRYHRTLDLLDRFVRGFRRRPFYAVQDQDDLELKGDTINATLRFYSEDTQSTYTIQLGLLNTALDLHVKLRSMTGRKYRLVVSGRELKIMEEPSKTLKDIGLHDNCILTVYLQQLQDNEPVISSTDPMEPEIMRHFEALYQLLDLPEPLAVNAWSFLHIFPPHASIKQQLLGPETPSTDILPPEKPYKCLYALSTLRKCFNEQESLKDDMLPFVHIYVSRLLDSLASCPLDNGNHTMQTRVLVLNETLQCLKVILDVSNEGGRCLKLFPSPGDFLAYLFGLLQKCIDKPFSDIDGVEDCIANAISVLFEAFKSDPQIWSLTSEDPHFFLVVHRFLVDDDRGAVRKCLSDAISAACTLPSTAESFAGCLWPILRDILSSSNGSLCRDKSAQLFQAALAVFEFLGRSTSKSLDLPRLFNEWFRQLRDCRVVEIIGNPQEDPLICGYSRLLRCCLEFLKNRGLAPEIEYLEDTWRNLLFPDSTDIPSSLVERMPCLHDGTRNGLYNLLLDLVKQSRESIIQMIELNNALFREDQPLYEGYWADRDRWLKAPSGHTGLQNLSNTCYLNSLLTQLYMNRTFRNFVLLLPVNRSDETRRSSYCLKALFARMQGCFQRGIEPRDLVESLRDFAGEPIDPTVQMDVDEFFNLLFDRLESEMPSPSLKSSFRSYYGGQLVQQVKSNECEHISERTEPFSAIQCDIKGKFTLQESLKSYVEGEIMEGDNKYRCTTCDRLVDAVKRTCLKDVPDHLICHLKRFDFDLQTMHRSKINDRFEFPTVLDLKPYTLGHLSGAESDSNGGSKSDEFELVGVLVHTGTAESGHYYSYIRDRLSPGKMPIWFEFNDSEVSVFDHSTIAENCYGGSDGLSADGYSLPKSFSAYMLFYQRSSSLQAMRKLETAPSDTPEAPISTDIRLEIFRENEELVKRHSMFASDYISFVEQLIITYDEAFPSMQTAPGGEGEIDVLLLGLRAFEQICTRVKDFPVTDALATAIERFISRNAECCRIFLEWASNEENINSLIVGNPFATVRSTFSRLLIRSVYRMRGSDERLYGIADDDDEALPRRDTMLFKIFRGLCEAWNALQWTFKPWGDFFGFLVEVASWGPDEQECMLSAGILKRLLEMFLIDHISPSDRTERGIEHFAKALSKPRVPATKPVELLCSLMERCSPFLRPTKNEAMRDRYLDLAPLPLTVAEGYYFKMMDRSHGLALFIKLIELPGALPVVIKLIRHLISSDSSPEEHEFLDRLVTTLLSGISIDPAAHADPYLHCLHAFVAATKSQRYVNEIVRKVAMEIPTIGISGGCEHLRFFKGIYLLDGPDRHTRSSLLENIGDWAPALVVYCDGGVREETEEFLDELIFEESASFYPEVQQAAMNLASGCFDFVNKFPGNRQSVDESTFSNVLRVLARCKDAEQDPETFETKLEELRTIIDRLVLEEEQDVDLASDEWAASELGSDREGVA